MYDTAAVMYDTSVRTPIDEPSTALNGIPAPEIKAQLDRILNSHIFVHSHRIRRFLQFVVEECLLGQHHRLKEYPIGLEVFNRREAFDPRVDSIVRVEARRLRAKLEEYYLTEGREDELQILLRKGSYVPVFDYRRNSTNGLGGMLPSRRRSIAIVPFPVLNGGGDHSALVDEIKRRLAHVLIKEGFFRVLAAPQATPPSGEILSSNSAAGVYESPKPDFLIEGSVEIHDQCVRLIIQLLNAIDGSYGWSETADCSLQDLSKVEELARALNRALLTPRKEAVRAKLRGENRQSYDAYLQGRYYWKLATPESVRGSVGSFKKATESDPDYAAAWAALAEALALSSLFGFIERSEANQMKEAAEKAVELNDSLPEAHLALGAVLSIRDWNWMDGEIELQRAIQLDGHDPVARVAYGIQLACRGITNTSILELERALELDPASPLANFALGWVYGVCGRLDEAISQHRLVAQLAPDFPLSYLGLGWAHCGKYMFQDAIAHFTNAGSLLKCRSLLRGCLGYCYARSGQKEAALRELAVLNGQTPPQSTSAISSAAIYAGLGDPERALTHLQQAFEAHDTSLPLHLMRPEFQSLATEPGFRALRRNMGL